MCDFDSLVTALEGWFEKPLCDLPDELHQRAQQSLYPKTWDKLDTDQRRSAVHQWDCMNNPAAEHNQVFWWTHFAHIKTIKQKIDDWEARGTPTTNDMGGKENRLNELKKELARIELYGKSLQHHNLMQQHPYRELREATTDPDSLPQYIAYPKALQLLRGRLEATPAEMAAWIWLGSSQGGLVAYLNANELDSPPRFYYEQGDTDNFDYLSPLMACWFREDDIANFQPADRYITGETLIERWGKQPGIQPEAFIRAKIAESRLLDIHPICGVTQGFFPDTESYPPLRSGLFAQSNVEMIENEDFSGDEPETETGSKRTAKRDKALQVAANALAKEWQDNHRQFSKRNIAAALAKTDEWKDTTADRIERILRVEW